MNINLCSGHISKILNVTKLGSVFVQITENGKTFPEVFISRKTFNRLMKDKCIEGRIVPADDELEDDTLLWVFIANKKSK